MAGGLSRGEVRIYAFPPPDKQRPVLILTRSSALKFLHLILVAPITSTQRGIPTEVALGVDDGMKHPCAVNLDQLQAVPKERLGRLVATLTRERMREVCAALAMAVGCDV